MFSLFQLFPDDPRMAVACTVSLVLVLLISFSCHEFAHAHAALKCGDPTAKAMGRHTLNPMAHIDPIGFVCCMLFCFGWAKPVPINPLNFKDYRKGYVKTSLAGVIANIILAFVGCGLLHLYIFVAIKAGWFETMNTYLFYMILYFFSFLFTINISLFIFNLLPIPPLDGFNVLDACTKSDNKFVNFLRHYGIIILLIVVLLSDYTLAYLVNWVGYPIEMFWLMVFGWFA